MKPLKISLLSPWYGGSHKRWADGLKACSIHEIEIYSLPDRHWKWRMHGAAVTLAQQVLESGCKYDLFLADDMMDVAVFSSMMKGNGQYAPIYTYFHENQICYPVSPMDTDITNARDLHYGYVNFTTGLVSDKLMFNSAYHKEVFLGVLPEFLAQFPDCNQQDLVRTIVGKSLVLPLGMDLKALDHHQPEINPGKTCPLILWNHRWEYDKCPDLFLKLLLDINARGIEFDVVLLGERGKMDIEQLDHVMEKLGNRILWNGEASDFADYAGWLWRADIVPVTAIHDFFGASVVEALYCQCHVLLPNRLAYPEHVSNPDLFYVEYPELLEKVIQLIESDSWRNPPRTGDLFNKYDWSVLAEEYDRVLAAVD